MVNGIGGWLLSTLIVQVCHLPIIITFPEPLAKKAKKFTDECNLQ